MREGWEYKKLGEVCTIERGGSPRPITEYITDAEDGLNWIKIGDATEGSKYITSTKEKIKPEGLKKTRLVHKGDFILSNSMSFGRPYILGIDGCIHDGWLVIHDNKGIFDKNYLYYVLGSPNMFKEFQRLAVGGVVNNLNSQLVRNVSVAIPPLSEQQRIVSELDLLTSIIDKQKAQLKELDTLAQSIFYDMFGDPVENERGWEVKRLEEIVTEDCPISYGIVQPGEGVEEGVPVVRPVDMTGTFIHQEGLKITTKEISDSYKRTILKGNEILMCVRGTTGLVALATLELKGCNVTRGVTPIECNEKNSRWFIYFQFKTSGVQQYISDYTKGITLKQINMSDVRAIPLIVPPLSLQQSFAAKIEAIEKQKAAISSSLAETQKLFDYTMDKYFG